MAQNISLSVDNELFDNCMEYFDCDSTQETVEEIRSFARDSLKDEVVSD